MARSQVCPQTEEVAFRYDFGAIAENERHYKTFRIIADAAAAPKLSLTVWHGAAVIWQGSVGLEGGFRDGIR